MPYITPKFSNPFGETLTFVLCNQIVDIVSSNGRIWLITGHEDQAITLDPAWMIPLLCPICGKAWHFDRNKINDILPQLRETLIGYVVAEIKYYPAVSPQNAKAVLRMLYSSSDVFRPLIEDIPDHFEDGMFPAISLLLEKQEPMDFELDLSGTEKDIRERYEISIEDNYEEAIAILKEMERDPGVDVTDDLMLLIHPVSVLEVVAVFPNEHGKYEPVVEVQEDDEDVEGDSENFWD